MHTLYGITEDEVLKLKQSALDEWKALAAIKAKAYEEGRVNGYSEGLQNGFQAGFKAAQAKPEAKLAEAYAQGYKAALYGTPVAKTPHPYKNGVGY